MVPAIPTLDAETKVKIEALVINVQDSGQTRMLPVVCRFQEAGPGTETRPPPAGPLDQRINLSDKVEAVYKLVIRIGHHFYTRGPINHSGSDVPLWEDEEGFLQPPHLQHHMLWEIAPNTFTSLRHFALDVWLGDRASLRTGSDPASPVFRPRSSTLNGWQGSTLVCHPYPCDSAQKLTGVVDSGF